MPPVHERHTVYRIQHHLGPTLIRSFLPPLEWRVLEHKPNAVVAHVCAYVYCELGGKTRGKVHEFLVCSSEEESTLCHVRKHIQSLYLTEDFWKKVKMSYIINNTQG